MIRVGVLRGGTGEGYEKSLASGAYLLKHLPRDLYQPVDIFLDTEGTWHLSGIPLSYEKLKLRVDVIWNSLHGFYGEDGKAEQILETLGIPHTGPGAFSSAVAMNNKLAKGHIAKLGNKTPRGIYIEEWGNADEEEIILEIVRAVSAKFSPPWNVQPISRGQGAGPIRTTTRSELAAILRQLQNEKIPVLIEEEVRGREVSVIVSSGFRREPTYIFIPMHEGKPNLRMKADEAKKFQDSAKNIHKQLSLGAYSRISGIVTQKGQIFITGIETMPVLVEGSHLHHSLDAVGASFDEFAKHFIGTALNKK